MKFSVGDKIIVKKTGEEGFIETITTGKIIHVNIAGVSFPIFEDEIDHPYLTWFLNAQKEVKKKSKVLAENIKPEKNKFKERTLPEGMYLVFLPIYTNDGWDESIEKCRLFLYNETFEDYTFNYQVSIKNQEVFSIKNEVNAESEFYIHYLNFEDIASSPVFSFTFRNEKKETQTYSIHLKTKKLIEKLEDYKTNNLAFVHEIIFQKFEVVIEPIMTEKKELKKIDNFFDLKKLGSLINTKKIQPIIKTVSRVDLHAENFIGNAELMNASEILYFQLQYFKKKMDEAIMQLQPKLVVIHGIGNGTLKKEVHAIANAHPYVKEIINDFSNTEGIGTSEIYFNYI
jgi:hypothetical protein